ncbi:MAG: response regulator [Candidatus Limnocylindria bacterium]
MDDLLTLAIELAFVAVFAGALVTWIRRRDVVTRDVTLIFAPMALLFAAELTQRTVSLPGWFGQATVLLLLAQPTLTLNLVADLGLIRHRYLLLAAAGFAVTAVPLVLVPPPIPGALLLAAVLVFFATEALAAIFLAVEARRRGGSARTRLWVGSAATALFAVALLLAGLGSAAAGVGEAAQVGARLAAVLSAAGYVIAFLPPGWLRRVWEATAAFGYTQHILDESLSLEQPDQLWARFTRAALQLTGARAVAVAIGSGESRTVVAVRARNGAAGDDTDMRQMLSGDLGLLAEVDHVAAGPAAPPAVATFMAAAGSRGASVGTFDTRAGVAGTILLAFDHPSLFHGDDRRLLGILATRTAILAERAEILVTQAALSERLEATVEALRSASQAKSDFLASMSHELRTPLSAVIGFSELMRTEPSAGEGLVAAPLEWVEHINRSGEHLLGLINDVLDLTKIEAGRIDLSPQEVDLRHLVTEVMEGVRPLAQRRGQSLAADLPQPTLVHADRSRLRQILYNLLSNAIKYTPDGGSVRVEAAHDGEQVALSVADTGVGIAPEDQERIFDEFSQVGDVEARQGGTGLGLALTRRLVEAHGGSIELVSAPGRGSTFTVRLPATPPTAEGGPVTGAAPVEAPEPARRQDAAPGAEAGPADILLIEDDPGAVRLLRAYLEADGYAVRATTNGEHGLAEARRRPPGAIVLDVLLPGMDGWEVLRRLKGDAELRDIPVIVVTVVDERELGLALGAVDYYLKPVDRAALLARLARYTFTSKVRSGRVRVLAIDDDPAALELIRAALVPEGFEVTGLTDPSAAVNLARTSPFELVICDLVMPGMDGFEVIAALRQDPATSGLPILVLTAHGLTQAEKDRLNGNIVGLVEKGDDAVAHLREWLGRALPGGPGGG